MVQTSGLLSRRGCLTRYWGLLLVHVETTTLDTDIIVIFVLYFAILHLYECVCVCDRVLAKSASERCISSSGQVFNLCDPARDYGGSGSKNVTWNSPFKPKNWLFRVLLCVWFVWRLFPPAHRINCTSFTAALFYFWGNNFIVWACIIVAAPQPTVGL